MAQRSRSTLASIVGWVLVIVLAWWFLGFVFGTLRWIIRTIVFAALLLGLLWLYLSLKTPNDEE